MFSVFSIDKSYGYRITFCFRDKIGEAKENEEVFRIRISETNTYACDPSNDSDYDALSLSSVSKTWIPSSDDHDDRKSVNDDDDETMIVIWIAFDSTSCYACSISYAFSYVSYSYCQNSMSTSSTICFVDVTFSSLRQDHRLSRQKPELAVHGEE